MRTHVETSETRSGARLTPALTVSCEDGTMGDDRAGGRTSTTTRIQLLGRPCLRSADGRVEELRGVKPWALLARVILTDEPVSRRRLAAELFPDADDPLGAVRWALTSIRRALGTPGAFTGDPVDPRLPDGVTVDALDVLQGRFEPSSCGELLEDAEPHDAPDYSTWLLIARRHLAARVDALLHDELISALSRGRFSRAVELGGIAVRRSPFDERAHVLFVRALAAAGDPDRALEHVLDVEARFRSELGHEPSAALRSAARRSVADAAPGVSASAIASSLLDAGRAALAAGAVDAGLDCLRRAAASAEHHGDGAQVARCHLALGGALVHSVRGFDDEGSILLDQAAHLARIAGDRETAVHALRERAYVDAIAGRRPEAETRLRLAHELADGDDTLLAGLLAVAGLNLTDWGRLDEGVASFEAAVEHARRAGDDRRIAWAEGIGAWSLVSLGRVQEARCWASDSLDLVSELKWVAFEPWPLTVLAEAGVERPTVELERCFAMSCQLEDPCWEGASARALAIAASDRGDHETARRWINEARGRAGRKPDVWIRVVGEILLSEARLLLAAGDATRAGQAAREAVATAARTQLDDVLRQALDVLRLADG